MCDEVQVEEGRRGLAINPDICHQLTEQTYIAREAINTKENQSSNEDEHKDQNLIPEDMRRRRRNITSWGKNVSSYLQLHEGNLD